MILLILEIGLENMILVHFLIYLIAIQWMCYNINISIVYFASALGLIL
jgi:hypothetical protein